MQVGQTYKIKPGREGKCRVFVDGSGIYIKITSIGNSRLYYDILNKNRRKINTCSCFKEADLIMAGEDINHPCSGMIVEDTDLGSKRKVLGVCDQAVFLSEANEFNHGADAVWTIKEFVGQFKVKDQPEQEEKMIELSNGKEVSEATILGLLKNAGEG